MHWQQTYSGFKLAAALAAATALAGCNTSSDSGGSSSGETGQMSLAVTDAPVDSAVRVVVRFTHIELKPAGNGDRVRIDFDEPVREIDLLALQGDNSVFLFEDEEVPAGRYDWIRFYLEPDGGASSPPLSNFATSSFIEFEDEYRENLIIPGGLQAGLQLVSGFTVPANGSASFTVDFDLRKAIRPASDPQFSGYHRMRRALRIVDNANVGTITGTVDPSIIPADLECYDQGWDHSDYQICPGAAVYVFEGSDQTPRDIRDTAGDPVTTANVHLRYVEESGDWEYRYTAGFLLEGDYTVALTFAADLDDPEEETPIAFEDAANASVEAGETTVVDFPTDD